MNFKNYKSLILCIGAGKTGIDAVLFLLNHNVDEDKILWIMPNDAWLWNRDLIFPDKIEELALSIFNTYIR